MKQEKRGIYNVTFNDKRAAPIHLDPDLLEKFIQNTFKEAIIMYMKGFHDYRRDKGIGAEHIKIHLEVGSEGEITINELLNLGNSLRGYLKKFKEPFVDNDRRKIYEWENDERVRFRAVSDKLAQKGLEKINQMGGSQIPLSPFENTIITFYSDRNLNERMEFKNPLVTEYYENLHNKNSKNLEESYIIPTQRDINELFKQDSSSNLSLEQRLSLLQENQSKLESMPKASNIIQHTTESLQRESQNNTDTQQSTHTAQNGADKHIVRKK